MPVKRIRYAALLTSFFSIIAVVLVIILTANSYRDFRDNSKKQMLEYGELIYRDIASVSAEYLFMNSYPSIQHIVNEYSHRDDIRGLRIADSNGIIIASTEAELLGKKCENITFESGTQPVIEYLPDGSALSISGPVRLEHFYLGHLNVFISMDRMNRVLNNLLMRNVFLGGIFLIIIIAGVFTGVRFITNPVSRLSAAMEKFSRGEYQKIEGDFAIREISSLQHEFNTMADKLAVRETELKAAREDAERANEVKSMFLANISHELRTPLNGILGFSRILDETRLENSQRIYLDKIKYSAEALSSLIRNLFDLLDLESGVYQLNTSRFNLGEMMKRIDEITIVMIGDKDIKYSSTYPDDVYITADRSRLEQIIIQLLSNSIKFTSKGEIKLDISVNGDLDIRMADSGTGMKADNISRVFNVFEQLEDPLTKSSRGAGLGLPIVKLLVDLMKGRIDIASVPGLGTTVSLSIPVAKTDGAGNEVLSHTPGRRTAKILLVEDEAINRLFLKMILEKDGFDVVEAENGRQAIESFNEENFDLILMDIGLPGMNGIDTTMELTSCGKYRQNHPPIVAVTANTQEDIRSRCLAAGMARFLPKPVSEEILNDTIFSLLDSNMI